MANKLKNCDTCDALIAKNAKSCPQCGAKNVKQFYQEWLFWVIVVIIIAIINSNSKNNTTSQSTAIQENYTANTGTFNKPYSLDTEVEFGNLRFMVDKTWRSEDNGEQLAYNNDVDCFLLLKRAKNNSGRNIAWSDVKKFAEDGAKNFNYSYLSDVESAKVAGANGWAFSFEGEADGVDEPIYADCLIYITDDYGYFVTFVFAKSRKSNYENLLKDFSRTITDVSTPTNITNPQDAVSAPASVFNPKDVSDKTIESIQTYNDYLTMCQMIIEDYYANYERAIKGTILWNEDTFAILKQTQNAAFEQQKKSYGAMGNMPIVGKADLVKFLKEYRDELNEYVQTIADVLK